MSAAMSRPLSIDDIAPLPRTSAATMPAVSRLGGKLAESFGATLSSFDGAPWRVTLDHIGNGPSAISEDTGGWFRVETHKGSMTLHLAFDRNAVSACCEAALGGSGAEAPYEFPGRPYSGIEKGLIQLALKGLEARTATVFADQLATPVSRFEGLVDPEEISRIEERIIFRFLANVFGYSGELFLTANSSEIAVQFGAAGGDAAAEPRDVLQAGLQRRIAKAEIAFKITLGAETVLVDDLASLAPGKHLVLASCIQTPVLVCSGDNPVFKASLTRAGERLAVRIIASAE